MNRDDIIRMAEKADAYADKKFGLGEWHPDKHEFRDEHFANFVAAAVLEKLRPRLEQCEALARVVMTDQISCDCKKGKA